MSTARRWFLAMLLLAVIAGCFRLRFDVQILNLLPPSLKVVEGLKLYQDNFSNNRELIVSLRMADAPTADAAAGSLAGAFRAQSNLVESVRWRPVWLEDPTLSAELLAYIWFNQAPADFRALADQVGANQLGQRPSIHEGEPGDFVLTDGLGANGLRSLRHDLAAGKHDGTDSPVDARPELVRLRGGTYL